MVRNGEMIDDVRKLHAALEKREPLPGEDVTLTNTQYRTQLCHNPYIHEQLKHVHHQSSSQAKFVGVKALLLSYRSTKMHVMCTQKNCLSQTVTSFEYSQHIF